MASKKSLKKEIKYLVNDLIAECEVYQEFHPEADAKKIEDIIDALQQKQHAIIKDINMHYPEKTPSEQKKHYSDIIYNSRQEMLTLLDGLPATGK